jgi:ATP-dependent 26S proteasome regulatory subunit
VRRLHVAIDFPFPEETDRLHIWRKVFTPEAPLADDVDLPLLARNFKLAGGNIRNIGGTRLQFMVALAALSETPPGVGGRS